jgi:hypothetical protein
MGGWSIRSCRRRMGLLPRCWIASRSIGCRGRCSKGSNSLLFGEVLLIA